jgi:hypothetical protein
MRTVWALSSERRRDSYWKMGPHALLGRRR